MTTLAYTSIKKYLILLNIQKEILKNNVSFLKNDEKKQNEMDSLYNSSVWNSLSFCLKYDKNLTLKNEIYSIENFKKQFEVINNHI
jgi:hypothetical protein